LNYTVTSNHIHLLVHGHEDKDVIPRSLQLIAGRTAQEYNQRKKRKGAFWEDRYHATAVDVEEHLVRCLVYIDLNMVRAKVVKHPREWSHGGYPEIIEPQQRYRIIDRNLLKRLLDIDENLSEVYSGWVQAAVDERTPRQAGWTESVAVGCKDFVKKVKELLGGRACGRRVHEVSKTGSYALKEPVPAYNDVFEGKMGLLSSENRLFWDTCPVK
jgi:putative transposase